MKILTEGHKYIAANFEDKNNGQTIQFIEKRPKVDNGDYVKVWSQANPNGSPTNASSTELETVNDGTTNEELLEILINRLNYLNGKFPCRENSVALTHLDSALLWLEKRTNDRKKRNVEGKNIS